MDFNNLKYLEKIAIAKLFYKEKIYNGDDKNFQATKIFINYNKFEFYGKAFDTTFVKISEIENFFMKNNKIIRKEKLSQIRENFI